MAVTNRTVALMAEGKMRDAGSVGSGRIARRTDEVSQAHCMLLSHAAFSALSITEEHGKRCPMSLPPIVVAHVNLTRRSPEAVR